MTLSILGVVAAITVPSIHRYFESGMQMAQFKVAYATLDNAMRILIAEKGPLTKWDWPGGNVWQTADSSKNSLYLGQQLANTLSVSKYCGDGLGCFHYGWLSGKPCTPDKCYGAYFKTLKGTSDVSSNYTEHLRTGKFMMKNNMRVSTIVLYPNAPKDIGEIRVDVNGEKGPNRNGYDVFYFHLDEKGIDLINNSFYTKSENCNIKSSVVNKYDGVSCSYWIIRHNNMDYKRRDVSSEW